jgi:hypothetical protein
MNDFVLIFRQGDSTPPKEPAAMQAELAKWRAWRERLDADGRIIATQGLQPTGKAVRGKARTVTDGPYAEAKDLVGGVLILKAQDIDEAVELAKGCPILERDGVVEVRPAWSLASK